MTPRPIVAIVDDEPSVLRGLSRLLETADYSVQTFSSPDEFLNRPAGQSPACLILDLNMPTMTGLELQERLRNGLETLPIIFLSGTARVPDSVQALRQGAVDFLTKPVAAKDLLAAVSAAVQCHRTLVAEHARREGMRALLATLTPREREVGVLVTQGLLNKQIAWMLNITETTVKVHRGRVMEKLRVQSVPDLVRFLETLGVSNEVHGNAAATALPLAKSPAGVAE
ncbi:MAG: response regulator [Bryobacteraceae bacterium]|nr:response regulator [Bryobacteraceae bacterium]